MDGALWALAGLLAAAGYQVLVKSTQENLKVCSSAFACEKIITLHTSICDLKKKLTQFSLAPHLGLHRYRHHAQRISSRDNPHARREVELCRL